MFKIAGFGLFGAAAAAVGGFYAFHYMQSQHNFDQVTIAAPKLKIEGIDFRDLNKNGRLDVYENPEASVSDRVEDLLLRMTLEEKAGLMFITPISVGNEGRLRERPSFEDIISLTTPINSELVIGKLMNHFNVVEVPDPVSLAKWHNNIQSLAERTRLGIPVTIASDPRNAFGHNPAASLPAGDFSLWPEPLGLAATRNPELVREFGRIARQEYRAVGIHLALHPMADLATEPRWARAAGTFGEDAELSAQVVYEYVKGFQGEELSGQSVATMVKHFTGGGPQKNGEDAHFAYGKEQVYPGEQFDYHLLPFEKGAFPAGAAQIMPYYGIPMGQTDEDVGFAFNKSVITGMLRERYGFDGVVCSDWGLLTDAKILGVFTVLESRSWGVEHLSVEQRALKMLDAGIDQIGGEHIPELVVQLVRDGKLKESRLDSSVRRLLKDKFLLGLFDNPYVDPEVAKTLVGQQDFINKGISAQRKSLVLLKNDVVNGSSVLPLEGRPKLYVENVDKDIARTFGDLVDSPADADFAVLRLAAPYQPRNGIFESFFHAGDLDFKAEEKNRLLKIMNQVPTVVDIYLDRAAVIPEIADRSVGLMANFGASDEVILDALFGKFNPSGKLPVELPSSMEAVRNQFEDVPYDSIKPLYPFGYGLSYFGEQLLSSSHEVAEN
ncbi:glycoside hydrolase family 3 N-terminal domain-containing protein [Maricurvus nonylphenolicus]